MQEQKIYKKKGWTLCMYVCTKKKRKKNIYKKKEWTLCARGKEFYVKQEKEKQTNIQEKWMNLLYVRKNKKRKNKHI